VAPADPDHLHAIKARLADIAGIDQLSVAIVGGRMVFGIDGRTIGLDPFSGDTEIETAIRLALSAPATAAPAAPAQIETPMPAAPTAPVAAAAPAKETAPVSVTGTGNVGQRLKQMMADHRAKVAKLLDDSIANVQSGMDKEIAGIQAVSKLGDKIHASGDDILSDVGQFSNDLGID
jgi:hypothetical protein